MATCTTTNLKTLIKQPNEVRLFGMDFSNKMVKGEMLLTIDSTVSTPTGINFTGTGIDSQVANVICSGGVATKTYKITVIVTTDAGQTLENEGYLEIKET